MDGRVLKIIKVGIELKLNTINGKEDLLNFSLLSTEEDTEYRIVRQKIATAALKKELDDIEETGIKELIGYRDTTSKHVFSFFYKMLANKEIKKLEKRIKKARKKVSEIEEKIKAEECS